MLKKHIRKNILRKTKHWRNTTFEKTVHWQKQHNMKQPIIGKHNSLEKNNILGKRILWKKNNTTWEK